MISRLTIEQDRTHDLRIEPLLHEAIRLKRTQRYDHVYLKYDGKRVLVGARDDAVSLYERWKRS